MNLHNRAKTVLAAVNSFVSEFREQFELGIDEFNAGRFFECHDTFEELWMEEHGERRRFLQGLIQAAVGVFHATRNNANGAESQLSKSLTKLYEAPDSYLGIDVVRLRRDLEHFRDAYRERVSRGESGYAAEYVPRIIYNRETEPTNP